MKGGSVVGHTHISVQDIGDAKTTTPPDANKFAFFKGINDAGDGKGTLSANLTAGLPAGSYRVCSMTSAANHQPVLMPIAQRGPQDDCVRFTVANGGGGGGNKGGNNAAANAGNANANAGAANANAGKGGQAAAANGQAAKGAAGGKGGKGKGRPKFAARDFIA